ncbi:SIR2 family protein, partial [Candidatus Bipolaricaulota bacterium]|nr:SIR2 family protein [Candidatus Bipolaricaulota bacterium]
MKGNVVLFAGAGISTEAEGVYPSSLYDEIQNELNETNPDLEFPDLASKFCRTTGDRPLLVRTILDRFRKAFTIRETYRLVTRFHRTLSTIYPLDTIVTTNWDDFFERECDALPFVIPEDMAFWNMPGRKTLKIHGSVSNLGTLIATREDYERCGQQLREGVLGSVLKTLLATRTILYIGYSLRDSDFLQIMDLVKSEMGDFVPRGYWISTNSQVKERAAKFGLIPIITDATYFLEIVKEHLVGSNLMFPDEKYPLIEAARAYVAEKHRGLAERIPPKEKPAMVFALSYQDGLMSAFDGICARQ